MGNAKRINAVILSSTNEEKNKLMSFHCGRVGLNSTKPKPKAQTQTQMQTQIDEEEEAKG